MSWRIFGPGPVHVPALLLNGGIAISGTLAEGWALLDELEEIATTGPGTADALAGARLWTLRHRPTHLIIADLPVTRP
ncbi:MAG: hypothetical protein Q8Q29_07590 [Actinomycetota bacterium]|nr:hypothetical protein [Actinomycetota bacterium]